VLTGTAGGVLAAICLVLVSVKDSSTLGYASRAAVHGYQPYFNVKAYAGGMVRFTALCFHRHSAWKDLGILLGATYPGA